MVSASYVFTPEHRGGVWGDQGSEGREVTQWKGRYQVRVGILADQEEWLETPQVGSVRLALPIKDERWIRTQHPASQPAIPALITSLRLGPLAPTRGVLKGQPAPEIPMDWPRPSCSQIVVLFLHLCSFPFHLYKYSS